MGAKTLLHAGTRAAGTGRRHGPRERDAPRSRCVEGRCRTVHPEAFDRLSNEDRGTLRPRHIHGDDRIRSLYAMTRSFAASHDNMAFTGNNWNASRRGRSSCTATAIRTTLSRWPWSHSRGFRTRRSGSCRTPATDPFSDRSHRHSSTRRSRTCTRRILSVED
jgi:hypothetical protein